MLKKILLVVVMATGALVAVAASVAYKVETVPNVRLSDAGDHVSDPASLLSQAAHDSINAIFSRLESSTGVEAAVVMLPSIGEADPFSFSVDLFRRWGIGKKGKDNGLIILYVEDQRAVRFTTGYGIEGEMTDAVSKRIQMTCMVPSFKEGKRDEGMVRGCEAAASVLDGTMKADDVEGGSGDSMPGLVAFAFIFVGLFVFFAVADAKRKCPQCKKRALKLVSAKESVCGGRRCRTSTYRCAHCGNIVVRKDYDDDDSTGAMLSGMAIGSMFGRGGGGGFGGGSFGGGSTGGGGAGSSW